MQNKRAQRRRDYARMKQRARRFYPDVEEPGMVANHLKPCSCYLCGNVRRMHGVEHPNTVRADDRFQDFIKELQCRTASRLPSP